jgi:hypothetical protein
MAPPMLFFLKAPAFIMFAKQEPDRHKQALLLALT